MFLRSLLSAMSGATPSDVETAESLIAVIKQRLSHVQSQAALGLDVSALLCTQVRAEC